MGIGTFLYFMFLIEILMLKQDLNEKFIICSYCPFHQWIRASFLSVMDYVLELCLLWEEKIWFPRLSLESKQNHPVVVFSYLKTSCISIYFLLSGLNFFIAAITDLWYGIGNRITTKFLKISKQTEILLRHLKNRYTCMKNIFNSC